MGYLLKGNFKIMKKNIKILLTCALAVAIALSFIAASPASVNTYGAQATPASVQQRDNPSCCSTFQSERGARLGVALFQGEAGMVWAEFYDAVAVGIFMHVYTPNGYRRHSDLLLTAIIDSST